MPELQLQHHPYGASGAHGWMRCHGKLTMEAGKPDKSSEHADKGSAAHYLAALCLTNGRNPADYRHNGVVCYELPGGRDGQVLFGEDLPDGAVERSTWKIDQKMAEDVTGYVNYVRDAAQGGTLSVEQRVEYGAVIGIPGAFGTADAVVLAPDGEELTIIDYKNGHIEVDAERNPQLMLYALGVLNGLDTPETETANTEDEFTLEEIDDVLKAIDPTLFEAPKKKSKKEKAVVEVKPCTVRSVDTLDLDEFELEDLV